MDGRAATWIVRGRVAATPSGARPARRRFGVFICLDCSGGQRRLGTHITFVRSCDMDEWTPEQLEAMKCGGNKNARAFFRANGVRDLHVKQDTKYSSSTARQYRSQLAKEVASALASGSGSKSEASQEATAPKHREPVSFFEDFEPTVVCADRAKKRGLHCHFNV